jgi:hypothetical protein
MTYDNHNILTAGMGNDEVQLCFPKMHKKWL